MDAVSAEAIVEALQRALATRNAGLGALSSRSTTARWN
jgi:hypothetical protein